MGMFSWLTADTQESIANTYSGKEAKPVYLLQPYGKPAIAENAYEGYGEFGDVDAYEWLARANLDEHTIARLDSGDDNSPIDGLRCAGIALEQGDYYLDTVTGKAYTVFHTIPFKLTGPGAPESIEHLNVSYETPIEAMDGKTANELIESGRLRKMKVPAPMFPLKFSHDPEAVYEELQPSKSCPNQGYFYDDGEEGLDEDNWGDCSDDEEAA